MYIFLYIFQEETRVLLVDPIGYPEKVRATDLEMHLWNIWFLSFNREWIFIKIHQFWSNWFIFFVRKNILRNVCLHF